MVRQAASVGGAGGGADYTAFQILPSTWEYNMELFYKDADGAWKRYSLNYSTYYAGSELIPCMANSVRLEMLSALPGKTERFTINMYVQDGVLYFAPYFEEIDV